MTTSTISTYYCAFCRAVKTRANKLLDNILAQAEVVGSTRAANELTRMGLHKEAKVIMMMSRKENK